MERGSSSSGSSFVVGFGENSCSTGNGLCSMATTMMAPPMNNSGAEMDNKQFFPLAWNSSAANSSNGGQRVCALFPQDRNQGVSSLMELNNADCQNNSSDGCYLRAKIMGHPLFSRLLKLYVNCQKVGAPPEVMARLEEVCASHNASTSRGDGRSSEITGCVGEDPALDQFMEAYCEMLAKYEEELTKPFKEAMLFFSRMESQLKALEVSSVSSELKIIQDLISTKIPFVEADFHACRFVTSKEEEVRVEDNYIDTEAEDKDLKLQLLRKYSGYLGSLKQEFLKKKKNGKLPKEARQKLLDWWTKHYKWPYPSEGQKVALADLTGLDLKQINNWFINQRKRHWRPSDDMQFVVMDADHPAHFYMDSIISNPFASSLL